MHRLPIVYTAALAASGDQAVAEHAAERVMVAASSQDASALAEKAPIRRSCAADFKEETSMSFYRGITAENVTLKGDTVTFTENFEFQGNAVPIS